MKSDIIQTFSNDKIGEIRGFIKDGEPWFLAGQVCRNLGIKDAGNAVKQVTDRLKTAEYKGPVSKRVPVETNGGVQKSIIIPENYLYELIFASRKKKAILFRSWVTSEVLPSLRKTGEFRMVGKLIHGTYTDSIKDSGENERMHGHGYSTYQAMINKSLGLPRKIDKDSLPPEILEVLAIRENLVKALIDSGKQYSEIRDLIDSYL